MKRPRAWTWYHTTSAGIPSNLPAPLPPGLARAVKPACRQTGLPSNRPAVKPACRQTNLPSYRPAVIPPAVKPACRQTSLPSNQPAVIPACRQTSLPSNQPAVIPACRQTSLPSNQPAVKPACRQTGLPSNQPAVKPACRHTGVCRYPVKHRAALAAHYSTGYRSLPLHAVSRGQTRYDGPRRDCHSITQWITTQSSATR